MNTRRFVPLDFFYIFTKKHRKALMYSKSLVDVLIGPLSGISRKDGLGISPIRLNSF